MAVSKSHHSHRILQGIESAFAFAPYEIWASFKIRKRNWSEALTIAHYRNDLNLILSYCTALSILNLNSHASMIFGMQWKSYKSCSHMCVHNTCTCMILWDLIRYDEILWDSVRYCAIQWDMVRFLWDSMRCGEIWWDLVRFCEI